jgi:3-hydroxymyristoyl/3-hydroxydecanoyl-(acyl carrier protein) dehydratase
LELQVEYLKHKKTVWKIKSMALVDGEVVCKADLTSATWEYNK